MIKGRRIKDTGPIKDALRLDPVEEAKRQEEFRLEREAAEKIAREAADAAQKIQASEEEVSKFSMQDPDLKSVGASASLELTAQAMDVYLSVPKKEAVQEQLPQENTSEEFVLPPRLAPAQGRVFCVGVDNQVNSKVRRFLQQIGMQTVYPPLDGQGSQSIIEQYQSYGQMDFALVILSPDELMFQRIQDPKAALTVSSQETVFDLGFLVGKLGRSRVAVFYEEIEKFKRPTEYFDILYTAYDDKGMWQEKLYKQLNACGLIINETIPAV